MNQFGISDKSYQLLLQCFSEYPEIEEVIIFGSRAKGKYKPGSDIDLAIKGIGCNAQTAFDLKSYLNEELPIPYHVDVVHYESLEHTALKDHIDRIGKLLYEPATAIIREPSSNTYKNKTDTQE